MEEMMLESETQLKLNLQTSLGIHIEIAWNNSGVAFH